jgi:hypothetical protein
MSLEPQVLLELVTLHLRQQPRRLMPRHKLQLRPLPQMLPLLLLEKWS